MAKVPETVSQWKLRAQDLLLTDASIHNHTKSKSGSKIEEEQFILLRAFWPENLQKPKFREHSQLWIRHGGLDSARRYLQGLASWGRYLNSIGSQDQMRAQESQGTFSLARYYQDLSTRGETDPPQFQSPKVNFSPRVTRSMTRRDLENAKSLRDSPTAGRGPSQRPVTPAEDRLDFIMEGLTLEEGMSSRFTTPLDEMVNSPIKGDLVSHFKAVKDEQIVNTALILFLNALTLHHGTFKGEWSLHRMPFTVQKSNGKDKLFEARVDGLLSFGAQVGAIVEVKPHLREAGSESVKIRMQEAAQMAAWIAQYPPPSGPNLHRRLLVSQDRHEIYLTVASFDDDYVGYIRNTNTNITAEPSYLSMQSYGPFLVTDREDMDALGPFLVAVSLQGGLL